MNNHIKPDSKKIRELRIKQGLSLRELSNIAGVNIAVISKLENGHSSPTPKTAKKITDALGIAFDEIFSIISKS